ncbi:MAG: hypothetical protein JO252_21140, partial [Planctomycetaceae bacterium]|nr:hypothetical protein [Planctomycetaceae bacterium]
TRRPIIATTPRPARTFNRHDILRQTTGHGHTITMTVDGRPRQAFGNLVLRDHQRIIIKYT